MRVSEKEFVKRIAPLVCIKGKKAKKMQATQTYQILTDVGFIIISEEELRDIKKTVDGYPHDRRYMEGRSDTIKEILG